MSDIKDILVVEEADYVSRIEHISKDCEECSQGFDIYFDDKIYYVYTIYHEQFYFCNDYDCWTNFKENYIVFRVDDKINNYNYKIASD